MKHESSQTNSKSQFACSIALQHKITHNANKETLSVIDVSEHFLLELRHHHYCSPRGIM